MPASKQTHLVIIGGGSAAFAGAHEALRLGARVTMFNQGLPLGGTCLHVGCVPSKTLIRAAETLHRGRHTGFEGLRLEAELADFGAIMRQKRTLIEDLCRSNYEDTVPTLEHFELVEETAWLKDQRTVCSASREVTADRILIATGTSPSLPDIPGLRDTASLNNETAFALETLPASLLVLGGGYIALECAQMFQRFGVDVTLLQRSAHVLSDRSAYIGEALAGYLEAEGMSVHCGIAIENVSGTRGGVKVSARQNGSPRTFEAERLLVAMGRAPNTAGLRLGAAAVDMDSQGFVVVDDALATSAPGVYAAGDVTGDPQFVYTASYEAELAVRNALGHPVQQRDYSTLGWVIFTDPQVAGVGLDLDDALARGIDADMAELQATRWPRLRVARDGRGFIRLVRDRATGLLIGARIVVPEGGDLVTELGLAMRHRVTTKELAETLHPYLTLSEGIQRAAQNFEPLS